MKLKKDGFSLIELIISLFLLGLLGGIGLKSLLGFFSYSRDSSRLVELHNIDSVLKGYKLKSGIYPEPSDFKNIIYSGSIVWKQGVLGNSVLDKIGYSREVFDPLTKNKYTYSTIASGKQFSLAGVLEDDLNSIVVGDYNGNISIIRKNGIDYILALPSIISNNLSSINLSDILDNNKLVYNDYSDTPESYSGTILYSTGIIDFSANELVIFSGSIDELKNIDNQITLLQNLSNAYSGTILEYNVVSKNIDKVDLFSVEPSIYIKQLACDLINIKLKYMIQCL